MKKIVSGMAVFGAVMLSSTAAMAQDASVGTIRERPAATLLLPYFEVDLTSAAGRTTRFSVNDASAAAVLAHVTVWTDLSVPVLAFDVYLTGYDVQQIDMRDILNGNLPQTASAGQDPTDVISPKGVKSQDINFASCTGELPPAPLSASEVAGIVNALTGQSSSIFGGKCGGRKSPGLARGYVTIDTVNACTTLTPSDPGYYSGIISFQNVLWGDFAYVSSNSDIQGGPLVAVVSNTTDPATTTSGNYTFYGRYNGWTAADNRQPLATSFGGRYFKGATQVVVWRDPKMDQGSFACGGSPPWLPLGQEGVVFFDEQEHPQVLQKVSFPFGPQPPGGPPMPFPAATQKVQMGTATLPVSFSSGWAYYDLNVTVIPAGSVPPADPAAAQAWVMTLRNLNGSSGVFAMIGGDGVQLDSASAALHFVP